VDLSAEREAFAADRALERRPVGYAGRGGRLPGRQEVRTAGCKRAGVDKPLRPFHGIRHSALTNDAASGMDPIALMTRAGHSSFKATQEYIHLAGELFPREVAQAAARKFGHVQAQNEAQTG
jgi:integrase